LLGHRADRGAGLAQQVGRQRQPPGGEEGHRRFADQLGEPAGEGSPRHAGLAGQARDGPRLRRVVLQHPQGPADHRVALGPVPAGRLRLMTGQPRAQHRDEQQVEQPVEDRLLPRLVPGDLPAEHRQERRVPLVGRHDHEPGQDRQQLPADLAVPLVGADQHGGRPRRAVPPGAHAEAHRLSEMLAVRGGAVLPGVDDHLGLGGRVAGEGVRVGAADDRDAARLEPDGRGVVGDHPGVPAHHRHQRQRRPVLDPHRPGRVHLHQQRERASGTWAVKQATEDIHTIKRRRTRMNLRL